MDGGDIWVKCNLDIGKTFAKASRLSEKDKFTMLSGIAHDPIQRGKQVV